jgi:hypothetical protein
MCPAWCGPVGDDVALIDQPVELAVPGAGRFA